MGAISFRIDLVTGGVGSAVSGFARVGASAATLNNQQQALLQTLPKVTRAIDTQTRSLERWAQSAKRASAAGGSIGALTGGGPGGGGASGAAGSAGQAAQAGQAGQAGPKFLSGPRQLLAKIAAQRQQLGQIADPQQRAAVARDLDQREHGARRSIAQGERQMQPGSSGLFPPGLLPSFQALSSLLGSMGRGNLPGAISGLNRLSNGIQQLRNSAGVVQPSSGGAGPAAQSGGGGGSSILSLVAGLGEAVPEVGAVVTAFTGVVGIVTAVFQVLSSVVSTLVGGMRQATEEIAQMVDAARVSGGSMSEISQLSAFGLSGGQITSLGQSFRERSAAGGDVSAQMARARLGLGPTLGGPFGPVDEAGDLVKAIEGLRRISNPAEQLRVARMGHLESLLPAAQTSAGVFGGMKADASARAGILNQPGLAQASTDLTAALGRLWANVTTGFMALVAPLIKPIGDFVNNLANHIRAAVPYLTMVGKALARFFQVMVKVGESIFGSALNAVGGKENLFQSIAKGLVSVIEFITKGIVTVVGWVAEAVEADAKLGAALSFKKSTIAWWNGLGTAAMKVKTDMEALEGKISFSDLKASIDANTQATERNTQSTDEFRREGTFGSSQMARYLLGGGASGESRRRAIEAHALNLGYWGAY